MNRSSSSSNSHQKKCSQVPKKVEMMKKKKQSSENPLQDVNRVKNSNSSSNISSVSIEEPKGCLRFFLSHSSSTSSKTPLNNGRPRKALLRTPKSAPISRPSNTEPQPKSKPLTKESTLSKRTVPKKPISQKIEKVKKWRSGKNPSSIAGQKSKNCSFLDSHGNPLNKLASGSKELLKQQEELHFTPLSKFGTGSGLDCTLDNHKALDDDKSNASGSNTKTPPIQTTFSPEIQCGSNMGSTKVTTPACYGAGYVLSGVTDRRKCRPKGLLAVGEYNDKSSFGKPKALNNFDDLEDEANIVGVLKSNSVSMVPLPAEASMHWLLSPCHEGVEDDKENSHIGSYQRQRLVENKTPNSPSSPLSHLEFSLDLCNLSNSRSDSTNNSTSSKGRSIYLLSHNEHTGSGGCLGSLCENVLVSSSPNVTPCENAVSKEGKKYRYHNDGGNSPFSMDTLGSENVIQTPLSDSTSEKCVGLSCLSANDNGRHHSDFKLISVLGDIQRESLSPNSHVSIWDTMNSSYQFDFLTTPSNSVGVSQFQKILDDRASETSNSALDILSLSQMRISWREGLVSRIFEMDDFDSCRFLSDEEGDFVSANGLSKSRRSPKINVDLGNEISATTFGSTEFVNCEFEAQEKEKQTVPSPITCSCAESISTDGGGLVRSEDSDWSLCYKNSLFKL